MRWSMARFVHPTAALLLVAATGTARADFGQQLYKLLPVDGAPEDLFGWSVAVAGERVLVGMPFNDDNGLESGAAYVFDAVTGLQLHKLLPSDGGAIDQFGNDVALRGTIAVIGAPVDTNQNGSNAGAAYIFDVETGQQLAKIVPDDGSTEEYFGGGIAVGGDIAVIQSVANDNGVHSGAAYVFDIGDPGSPLQLAKIVPSDGAPDDFFGTPAISGSVVLIGASGDDDKGDGSGSAYLFDISDPTRPLQLAKLVPTDGAPMDAFGASVAIEGTLALVGATFDDDNGSNSGSAYLFDISDPANPEEIGKLHPDDASAGQRFGGPVSIKGSLAIFGVPLDGDHGALAGAAYIFDIDSGRQLRKIFPDAHSDGVQFGVAVAIGDGVAVVGAYWDSDQGLHSGAAYVFDAGLCAADFNSDGAADSRDVIAFLNAWASGDGEADFDGNGLIDSRDVIAFLNAWVAGC